MTQVSLLTRDFPSILDADPPQLEQRMTGLLSQATMFRDVANIGFSKPAK